MACGWLGGNPEGQPVILWHGFLGTGYAWRDVAPALAETGLAVLAPDMRGYGDSDKPALRPPQGSPAGAKRSVGQSYFDEIVRK